MIFTRPGRPTRSGLPTSTERAAARSTRSGALVAGSVWLISRDGKGNVPLANLNGGRTGQLAARCYRRSIRAATLLGRLQQQRGPTGNATAGV